MRTDTCRHEPDRSQRLLPPVATAIRLQSDLALETVVLNELERRGADVGYVKTAGGAEVGFLARRVGARDELIQVCADPSDAETLERELRGLGAAAREHPRAVQRLLVLDRGGLARATVANVRVQPVYEWLLSRPTGP